MSHAIAFDHGEHAEKVRFGLVEEREQVFCRLPRVGRVEAKVNGAFGHRRACSIEKPSVIPTEGQKHSGFVGCAQQDPFIRSSGRVEHDGGYVVPSGRKDPNASQWKILIC